MPASVHKFRQVILLHGIQLTMTPGCTLLLLGCSEHVRRQCGPRCRLAPRQQTNAPSGMIESVIRMLFGYDRVPQCFFRVGKVHHSAWHTVGVPLPTCEVT